MLFWEFERRDALSNWFVIRGKLGCSSSWLAENHAKYGIITVMCRPTVSFLVLDNLTTLYSTGTGTYSEGCPNQMYGKYIGQPHRNERFQASSCLC